MQLRSTPVVCLLALTGLQVGGCVPLTVPVDINFQGGAVGEFDLEAGVPKQQATQLSFTAPVTIGSGSFEINPSAISIASAGSGGGKRIDPQQQQVPCSTQVEADGVLATCTAAGSTAAECEEAVRQAILACLGDVNTLEVTCWINDSVDTVFTNGDQYGPYQVTIDDAGQGVSVSPSSITLTQRTQDLLNSGSFAIGCELVYGQDGTASVDSITLNLGL